MSNAEETTEKPHSARDQIVVEHGTAEKVFSSPQVDFGLNLPGDFQPNLRALGQIYDVIQRFLVGQNRRGERYYPTTEDVFGDLQVFKRSISDKVPMPSEEELRAQLRLLAATEPPFVHFLRELTITAQGVEVNTSYTAPTEKHPDKVMVGYQATLRNSSNVLKDLLYGTGSTLYINWEERCGSLHSLDALELRKHRVDYFLKQLYVNDPSLKSTDFEGRLRMKKVNESINRFIYRPLIQQLYRDKMVLSFSCKDIRASMPGMERYSDLLLFNNPEQLQKRYNAIRGVLDSHLCWDYMDQGFVEGLRRKKDDGHEDDFYFELAGHVLGSFSGTEVVNEDLFDLALEVQKLSEWHKGHSKKTREKKEKDELQAIVERVRQHGDLVRVNPRRKTAFKREYLKMILAGRVPAIIWVTEPPFHGDKGEVPDPEQFEFIFLLYRHRTNTGKAIESALKLYNEGEDTYLVLLLDRLLRLDETPPQELKKYVPPVFLEKLRAAINKSYARYLPLWLRMWYAITSTEITDEIILKVKQRIKLEQVKSREAARRVSEVQEKKTARKQVKSAARARVQDEDKVLGALNQTIKLINRHWERGHFPTRSDVEDGAPEEQREDVAKVLGLVDAGAASVRAIRKIRLPSQTAIYAGEDFLKEHQAEIVRLCERHSSQDTVAVSDGVERTLQDPTRKRTQAAYTPEDYKAVLRHVQTV